MKYQVLFSLKNNEKNQDSSAAVMIGDLRVKGMCAFQVS